MFSYVSLQEGNMTKHRFLKLQGALADMFTATQSLWAQEIADAAGIDAVARLGWWVS